VGSARALGYRARTVPGIPGHPLRTGRDSISKVKIIMLLTILAAVAMSTPPAATAPVEKPAIVVAEEHGKIPWFTGTFDEAVAKAKAEKKLIFIDFWTTWCGWCKKLDKDTYTDDSVLLTMKDIICLSIDAESKDGAPIAKKYNITGYPTMVVLEGDGSLRDQLVGFMPPAKFKEEIERVRADKGTVGDLKKQVDGDGKSLDKRWKLASKLKELGDAKGYDAQMAEIKKLDPDGKSLPMRQAAFEDTMAKVNDLWKQKKGADSPALLKEFLAKETYPEILFNGYATLGQIYGGLGQMAEQDQKPDDVKKYAAESRKAQMMAWKSVADDQMVDYGNQLAWSLYEAKDDITAEDKTFALDVATKIAAKADKNAAVLDTVSCVQFMNGKKDDAIKTIKRAIEIDPKNDDYKARLKEFGG
jgi:thioredoxin 1